MQLYLSKHNLDTYQLHIGIRSFEVIVRWLAETWRWKPNYRSSRPVSSSITQGGPHCFDEKKSQSNTTAKVIASDAQSRYGIDVSGLRSLSRNTRRVVECSSEVRSVVQWL